MASIETNAHWSGSRRSSLAHRGMLLLLLSSAALLVGALLSNASTAHAKPRKSEPTAVVERVVDGDTLSVRYLNRTVRLRLIGVDAPESHDSDYARERARRTHQSLAAMLELGTRATHFMERLVHPGDTLRLEFESPRYDRYDRLLAYAFLRDGRMLNETLLAEGYGQLFTATTATRYRERFRVAVSEARNKRRGLWAFE